MQYAKYYANQSRYQSHEGTESPEANTPGAGQGQPSNDHTGQPECGSPEGPESSGSNLQEQVGLKQTLHNHIVLAFIIQVTVIFSLPPLDESTILSAIAYEMICKISSGNCSCSNKETTVVNVATMSKDLASFITIGLEMHRNNI
jgi:hypothetical protein